MSSIFQTPTDVVTRGALDGLAARHRAYVNNIANVDTPGFTPGDVPFEASSVTCETSWTGTPRLSGTPHRSGWT